MRGKVRFITLFVLLLTIGAVFTVASGKETAIPQYLEVNIPFIQNQGQYPIEVQYYANTFYGTSFITGTDITHAIGVTDDKGTRSIALKEKFLDPDGKPAHFMPTGENKADATVSYLKGADPGGWQTGLSSFHSVLLGELFPGVSVQIKARGGNVEKIFSIGPGANPQAIRIRVDGADSISVTPAGDLSVKTGSEEVTMTAPIAYQDEKEIAVTYQVRGDSVYGFSVGEYDRNKTLVIDPTLAYSTYLGGSGSDTAYNLAVDSDQNVFIVGSTGSTNFPVSAGAYQNASAGGSDVFVTKLKHDGTGIIYSTYLGGSSDDSGFGIVLDNYSDVFITGATYSTDFPVTTGALQSSNAGDADAFVTKLNPNGTGILYSTYLGGDSYDWGTSIILNSTRHVYITGITGSTNFPVTSGAFQIVRKGDEDTFVAKIKPDGTGLEYVTLIGGNDVDEGNGIAVDSSDNAIITGFTVSNDFPCTPGSYSTTKSDSSSDAFITKLNPSGTGLVYSTFIGGSDADSANGIALDNSDNVYITGDTQSNDFPNTTGAYQTAKKNNGDAFITKLNPNGTGLVYSTYLGSDDNDIGNGIVVDSLGNAFILGSISNNNFRNFPVTPDAYQPIYAGGSSDKIFTKINASGSSLLYSTYLGGSGDDSSYLKGGIAVDGAGNAYLTGHTKSTNFPNTTGAYQTAYAGGTTDAILTKFSFASLPAPEANFTANVTSGMAPLAVNFTDLSTGNPTNWTWDFGDGTNSTEKDPVHTYTSAGNYSVNLTVSNSAGSNNMLKSNYITVNSSGTTPVAGFSGNPRAGLVPLAVAFTDSSTGNITSWNWEYRQSGGDWTSFNTSQNATGTFGSAGLYDIRLTVTGPGGSNQTSRTEYIAVSSGPLPLTTVVNGTVTGDLYVGAFQPVAWSNQSSIPGQKTFNQSYTIPSFTNITWARLYAVVYAAGTDDRAGRATVSFDGDGDGTLETILGTEELGIPATNGAEVYIVNDHVSRQYSDYLIWYDVTGLISNSIVNAGIVTTNLSGSNFDGRLKTLSLIVAYNVTSSDEVNYWVNQGHDYQTSTETPGHSTVFGTGVLGGNCTAANLTVVHLSSKDASYVFNSDNYSGANPVSPVNYFGKNTWDVTTGISSGTNSNLAYTHAASSSFKTPFAVLTAKYAATPPVPVANFSANITQGGPPLVVCFTDSSTGNPTNWTWDFGDGTNSTEKDPVHTYTSTGNYSVNLTVSNSVGNNSMLKSNYITVTATPQPDLIITFLNVNSDPVYAKGRLFAREPNPIRATVKNNGTADAPASLLYINASDGFGASATIPSLKPGEDASADIEDTTIRSLAGNTINYTAMVDPDNSIIEAYELNNNLTITKTVQYNGYKGAHYWEGKGNVTTHRAFDIRGGIVHSFGDSKYTSGSFGSGWTSYTSNWTSSDLPLPTGATVREARLYVPYTWDNSNVAPDHLLIDFNGIRVPYEHWEHDQSNFGMYADYLYGLMTYNITDYFLPRSDNNATLSRPGFSDAISPYGLTLVVVYEDQSLTRKQVFLNEGFDLLGAYAGYATNETEATGYVPFTGMTIDPANVAHATLTTFVPSASGPEGNLYINGNLVGSNIWDYGFSSGPQVAVDTRDIRTYLTPTNNVIGIQSTTQPGACMAASQQFLVVEYSDEAPVSSFTGSPTSGFIPLTVTFTDTSTGVISSRYWEFGDGTTNTTQNPVHIYTLPGTYSVNLTVSGPGGSDHMLRTDYISVAGGVTVVSVNPSSSVRGKTVSLTIRGTNFTAGSSVNLTRGSDSIQATNVFSTGGNKITCKAAIPAGASTGPYDVIVTNNVGQTGILSGGFNVLTGSGPTISSLTPNTMYPNATWDYTLKGNNFQTGANVTFTHATFGQLAATATVNDKKNITGTLTLPLDGTTGKWDLTVTNPDGGSMTKKNAVNVKSWGTPAVTSVLPSTTNKNTTTSLVLTGKNFQPDLTTVFFNMTGQPDIPLTGLKVVSTTKITGSVSIPGGNVEGKWNAVVITADGGTGVKKNALTVKPWSKPGISTVMPTKAFTNSTVFFTIGGSNFQDGATVFFNRTGSPNLVPDGYTIVSAKKITGTLTIPPDTATDKWNLVVTTPDGGTTVKSRAIQITPWSKPTIGTITPKSGTVGTPVPFNLTGTNFQIEATTVVFNKTGSADVSATDVTVISQTKLTGNVTLPATGKWNVIVTTVDGGASAKKTNAFTVT